MILSLSSRRLLLSFSRHPSLLQTTRAALGNSCITASFSTSSQGFQNYSSNIMAKYSIEQRGGLFTGDYKLYFRNAETKAVVSPMHDIPLKSDAGPDTFNMVVEVPRWSNAKMEISLTDKLNPIKQDVKKGKLRFVANCFPHKGYIWNYGALPQTWEDPSHVDASTKCKGDGDPIDVCEIGQKVHERGAVITVKVLGTLAMIDEGETDWKILAIDVTDPLAEKLNDVQDIEEHMPGFLAATVEWFKIYKMPDGKPANTFAFDSKPQDKAFAVKIINECAEQFQKMMAAASDPESGLQRTSTVYECPAKVAAADADAIVAAEAAKADAAPLADVVDKWHYVKA